jgi:hypothetical protein
MLQSRPAAFDYGFWLKKNPMMLERKWYNDPIALSVAMPKRGNGKYIHVCDSLVISFVGCFSSSGSIHELGFRMPSLVGTD